MQKQIYYIVKAIVKKSNQKEEITKIEEIFIDDEPKKLRKKAFKFFEELRDKHFLKRRYCQKAHELKNKLNDLCILQNNTYYNLDLVISFGFHTIGKRYFYEKTFPIGAIGFNIRNIENTLITNLVIEQGFYKLKRLKSPETACGYRLFYINLEEYFVNNFELYNNIKERFILEIIKNEIEKNKTRYKFFETPQFYQLNYDYIDSNNSLFFDDIYQQNKDKNEKKIKLFRKELILLRKILPYIDKEDIKYITKKEVEEMTGHAKTFGNHIYTGIQYQSINTMQSITRKIKPKSLQETIAEWI